MDHHPSHIAAEKKSLAKVTKEDVPGLTGKGAAETKHSHGDEEDGHGNHPGSFQIESVHFPVAQSSSSVWLRAKQLDAGFSGLNGGFGFLLPRLRFVFRVSTCSNLGVAKDLYERLGWPAGFYLALLVEDHNLIGVGHTALCGLVSSKTQLSYRGWAARTVRGDKQRGYFCAAEQPLFAPQIVIYDVLGSGIQSTQDVVEDDELFPRV